MKKHYKNFETMFISLKEDLSRYLKEYKIYHEISSNGLYYHFEILCNDEEVEKINEWLDENTIKGQ